MLHIYFGFWSALYCTAALDCQVSIMIELLVKKFLNFASVFQGEAQEVVQYGLVL